MDWNKFITDVGDFFETIIEFLGSLVSSTVQGLEVIASSVSFVGQVVPYLPTFLGLCVSTIISVSVIKLIWGR